MSRFGNSVILIAIVFATVCILGTTSAQALIVDFEGVAPASTQLAVGNNYTEEGFNFYNPRNELDAAIIGQPAQNTTGSDYYTWNSPPENNPVTLTRTGGSPFDFASLDVGSKNGIGSLATFDITGYLLGGGMVVANVIGVDAFTSLALGWTDLSHVEFAYVAGNFGAIDNLDLTPIPEPATLLLLGSGFIGLAGFGRSIFKKS